MLTDPSNNPQVIPLFIFDLEKPERLETLKYH